MNEFPKWPLDDGPYLKKGEFWFPHFNSMPENTAGLPSTIQIHDVTLRDGEQAPGTTFTEDERVRIAHLLDDIGVDRIEGGMPCVSDTQFKALKRMNHAGLRKSKVFGFGMARPLDAQLILDADCESAIIEHCANPTMCEYAYGLTPATMMERIITPLKMVKGNGLYTNFMGFDWFRAPIEFTKWLVESILNEVPIDGLVIVDTHGNATPEAVYYMISKFHEWFPDLTLEFHGHNNIGLGVANAFQAMKAGAKVVHTSMNGLGSGAGNVATEQVLVDAKHYYGMDLDVNLGAIYTAADMISKFAKVPLPLNQPIVGDWLYEYDLGTASSTMAKMTTRMGWNGQAVSPTLVGRPETDGTLLGKNAGAGSVRVMMKKYCLTATDTQVREIVGLIKEEGLLTKAIVPEYRFLAIHDYVCNKK